jgi:hypothetical protein
LLGHQLFSHSRAPQHFMEPEGPLPCSQEPFTGPYPEPNQSSPYHPILSFQDVIIHFINVKPIVILKIPLFTLITSSKQNGILLRPSDLYQGFTAINFTHLPSMESNYNGAGVGTLMSGESRWSVFVGTWGTSCWLPILSCRESYSLCTASLC